MRIAVCSDIHSNLEALQAVRHRALDEGADAFWILGDVVGYGADPVAVIEVIRTLPAPSVLGGNHDLAATGRFDVRWFNSAASRAIAWTKDVLDDSSVAYLAALEPSARAGDSVLVHGSVVDPAVEYVTNESVARASFQAASFACCFFGHTHLPAVFSIDAGGRMRSAIPAEGETLDFPIDRRLMLNPGSVGQPRDGDPRASFMLYEPEASRAVLHRVPYDVTAAADKIRAAGLPRALADRLGAGR